jgi:hypothetical protein
MEKQHMLFGKTKKLIEDKESEMKLNLSNNYKDAAYKVYLELVDIIEELKTDGKISDKDYGKLSANMADYKKMFERTLKR